MSAAFVELQLEIPCVYPLSLRRAPVTTHHAPLTLSWSRLAGVVTAVSYSFSPILSACEEASVAGEDGGVGGYVESVARDSLRVPPISKARVRSHITCAP